MNVGLEVCPSDADQNYLEMKSPGPNEIPSGLVRSRCPTYLKSDLNEIVSELFGDDGRLLRNHGLFVDANDER
jgi:hypothetical protein